MTIELINANARQVIIAANPHSGSRNSREVVDQLRGELETRDFHPVLMTEIEQVKQRVAECLDNQSLRAVVAAGGDGTVSLLANELPAGVPLAILPLGTENLLAKYLALTADPATLARVINEGRTVRLDAGRANGKLFLVMASCGFDADVVTRLHSTRKGHIRHWSYAKPIVNAISQYRYPTIRVSVGDSRSSLAGKWAFVFNVPRYAMNLPIVDDADPMDGQLDLCMFRGGNLIRGLYYLLAVITRQHRRWQETQVQRFRHIRIESDERVPFQLDGDPGGELPLEIEVQAKLLRVVVTEDWIDKNVF